MGKTQKGHGNAGTGAKGGTEQLSTLHTAPWKTPVKLASPTFPRPRRREYRDKRISVTAVERMCLGEAGVIHRLENRWYLLNDPARSAGRLPA